MRTLLSLSLVLLAVACGSGQSDSSGGGASERAAAAPDRPFNVLLLSIDTLRADHLSCYGYERETSPALDRFAANAYVFEQAYSESSWTLPSHFSMLTGLLPASHGVQAAHLLPSDEVTLLAPLMKAAGYATFAMTGSGWMSDKRFGPGFDTFRREKGFAESLPRVNEYIDGDPAAPFFGFLHTFEVHCPYTPAEPWASLFRHPDAQPFDTTNRCGNPHYTMVELSLGERLHIVDMYDGSIRQMDDAFAAFLARLEASGALANTIVIVTSDHGEEFFEHGNVGHGTTLHREVLSIPLIVHVPGRPGGRIDAPVGLIDIVPTIAELTGLELAGALDGRSLVPLFDGDKTGWPTMRLSELEKKNHVDSWMGPDRHLIIDRDSQTKSFYRTEGDPNEAHDLFATQRAEARQLVREVNDFHSTLRVRGTPGKIPPREVTEKELEELRRLGYVGDDE